MPRGLGILVVLLSSLVFSQSADPADWSSSKQTKFSEMDQPALFSAAQSWPAPFDATGPVTVSSSKRERFTWGHALLQSLEFNVIEQGFLLAGDKWSRYHVSHGKWFKDWMKSVKGVQQWDDGDPFLDNYIGHQLQGAVTGFIQVQNDPRGRHLEFSNSRPYWKSRMKAMAWNAAYSTQFELGPLSESSIQNLGSYQYRNCPTCKLTNGTGYVDLVITPTVGTGWLIGEDLLDKYVVHRIERAKGRNAWTNLLRMGLNPARLTANVLAGKAPWYRANRDDVR